MNLYDVLNDSKSLNITINGGQLLEVLDEAIQKAKRELEPEKKEEYLTIGEAAKKLDVDRTTLWRWTKTGYLNPLQVGGRRRYRASEVEKILAGK